MKSNEDLFINQAPMDALRFIQDIAGKMNSTIPEALNKLKEFSEKLETSIFWEELLVERIVNLTRTFSTEHRVDFIEKTKKDIENIKKYTISERDKSTSNLFHILEALEEKGYQVYISNTKEFGFQFIVEITQNSKQEYVVNISNKKGMLVGKSKQEVIQRGVYEVLQYESKQYESKQK